MNATANTYTAAELAEMLAGYIACMLWATNDESDPETGGEPMDRNYSAEDLAPEALDACRADCERFARECAALIAESGLAPSSVGHDLFLTRCHHGAGFWDRDLPGDTGDKLTDAAEALGEVWPVIGDDGLIYVE